MKVARSSSTVTAAYRRACRRGCRQAGGNLIWRHPLTITCVVLLSLCGCAWMKTTSTSAKPAGTQVAVPTDSGPQSIPAPPPAASPDQPNVSSADGTGPSSAAGVEQPAAAANPRVPSSATSSSPAKSKSPPSERPIKQADAAAASRPSAVLSVPSNKPPAGPTLDLTDLVQRLRDTRAIGVFTKLSLKNQVNDLLSEFRKQYKGQDKHPSSELRQRYDLLILKVLSLLQDADPALASAISSSREAIWAILADPDKFAKI
jgi:hypothetical protein